ncbi:MAG: SpoIIE family protein phosphatase [Alphaproteobacteria bacterium]|nr:SpoIIE family protein phosphatase [Alphaproteobacteria bacterium]MCB9794431.1 SpoIIE family protein phosphatase [Alphaproteobacteria bacterium]
MPEQPSVLNVLLLVYAIAIVINSIISGLLFARQRDPMSRAQLLMWLATLFALVTQGAMGGAMPKVLIGLLSVYAVAAATSHMLSLMAGVPVNWRASGALLAAGLGLSLGAYVLQLPFSVTTLPLLIGVAFPLLSTASRILVQHRGALSMAELGMVTASMVYGVHMLDFALLGDKPEFTPFGFSIGLLCIFTLSIFAPAVVVEQLSARTARTAAEMDAARRIQTQLLPQAPSMPGLELTCYMRPADEVGGDYYDIQLTEDRAWMLMGDVTGHGLSSGLVMLMAQSVMSSILHVQGDIGPGQLNLMANRILGENLARMGEERTMTIVSLCQDSADGFVFSGSHDDLFIYRAATGEVEVVEVSQFPFQLGLVPDIPEEMVSEARFTLAPGDLLLVITDGVTEAARGGDYAQGMYEHERLIAFLRGAASRPVEAIRDGLTQELERFTGGVFHDDVTFIIARRQEA